MNFRLLISAALAVICVSLGARFAAVTAAPIDRVVADAAPWSQSPGDLQLSATDKGAAVTGQCPPALYHPGEPPIVYVHVKVKNSAVWWQSSSPAIPFKTGFYAVDLTTPAWTSPGATLPPIAPGKSVYVDIAFYNSARISLTALHRFLVTVNPALTIPESDSSDEHNNTILAGFFFPAPCGPPHLTTSGSPYPLRTPPHIIQVQPSTPSPTK